MATPKVGRVTNISYHPFSPFSNQFLKCHNIRLASTRWKVSMANIKTCLKNTPMVYLLSIANQELKIQEPYQVLAKGLYFDPFSFIFGQVPKILHMLRQSFNFISISLLGTTRMLDLT